MPQHRTTRIISGLGQTFVIFKSFIHSLRIHTVCFDHTHPLTQRLSHPPPSVFFSPPVQCVLPTYLWLCGLPFRRHWFSGGYPLQKNLNSPSPSSYRLPIGPQLGVGFMLLCPLYTGVCLLRACLGLMNAAGLIWRDITIARPFRPCLPCTFL